MSQKTEYFGFTRVNLLFLIGSLLLIILGYILMSGGRSADGVSFNPEVFSFTRIGLAPILCTLGYLGMIPALLYRKKRQA